MSNQNLVSCSSPDTFGTDNQTIHNMIIWDIKSRVKVEKRSKNLWRASGFYGELWISVIGYNEEEALQLWQVTARYKKDLH